LLDPGSGEFGELIKRRRADWQSPSSLAYFAPAVEYSPPGGRSRIWFEDHFGRKYGSALEGGNIVGFLVADNGDSPEVTEPAVVNLLDNGRFLARPGPEYTLINCTMELDRSTLDQARQVAGALKLTPTGDGAALLRLQVAGATLESCRGRWVTVSGRVLIDETLKGEGFGIQVSDRTLALARSYSAGVPGWELWEIQHWVAPDAASIRLDFYVRWSGSDSTPTYLSEVRLARGAWKGLSVGRLQENLIKRSAAQGTWYRAYQGLSWRSGNVPGAADVFIPLRGAGMTEFEELPDGRLLVALDAEAERELQIYQVTPGSQAILASSRTLTDQVLAMTAADNSSAFVATGPRQVEIIDLTTGGGLLSIDQIALPSDFSSERLAFASGHLLVPCLDDGLWLVDMRVPDSPGVPEPLVLEGGGVDVSASGHVAAVLNDSRSIHIVDLRSKKWLAQVPSFLSKPHFELFDGWLVVQRSDDRSDLYRLDKGLIPVWTGTFRHGYQVVDVGFGDRGVRVAFADGGLARFALPYLSYSLDTERQLLGLEWEGNYALRGRGVLNDSTESILAPAPGVEDITNRVFIPMVGSQQFIRLNRE
jgi:hypothetical protein